MIPKLVHLSFKTKEIVNSRNRIIKNGLNNLINMNPDWKVDIYEDNEIDKYLRFTLKSIDYKLYKNCHVVEKLDVWRLLKIYNEGGLYMDLDRLYNIPLSNIVDEDTLCVLPTCNDHDFSQDFMLSSPGNPIYLETINLILQRRHSGIKHTYFLGAQTYMHAVTKTLTGTMINSSPGKEIFDNIRKIISKISFIRTYKETSPYNTVVFHDQDVGFDHEQEKRNLYKEFGLKHWTNEW
jgi:mannosyltransferase OCH1-like enzyme